VTGSRSGSLAMLTANPTQLICGKAQKAPGQDDQGLIMGGCGGSPHVPSTISRPLRRREWPAFESPR